MTAQLTTSATRAPATRALAGAGTLLRRYPLGGFFVLAFALTWLIEIPMLALPELAPLMLLVGWMPGLAALIAARAVSGGAGVRALLRRVLIWRVGAAWYLVAIPGAAALHLLPEAVNPLFGGTGLHLPALSAGLLVAAALQLAVRLLLSSEELAWSGFALPRMQARYGALRASLILGAIWAVWHLPLFYVAGSQRRMGFLAFLVITVALRVILTWVFNNTGGSVLLVTLMHQTENVVTDLMGPHSVLADQALNQWLLIALLVGVAGTLVAVFGPAWLSRRPSAAGPRELTPALARIAGRGSVRTRARALRAISWGAASAVTLLALVAAGAAAYDTAASASAESSYPPPGHFATLASGKRVHYVCAGQHEPTVVLFAGFGGDALDWTPLMPAISRSQRVCAFDRLGQGWSDAPDTTATFDSIAGQLHEAIRAAGIERPIVAGHSLGGALAQVYAAKYDVAGLVIVDGLTSGVAEPVLARLGTYQSLAPVGRLGLLRPIAGMMVDPAYTPSLREQMLALRARSSALGAVAREGAVAAESALPAVRAAEGVLGSGRVPVLVIAAGATDVPQLPKGAFIDAQRAFAQNIPGARLAVVEDARHYVMAERPDEVATLLLSWSSTLGESR